MISAPAGMVTFGPIAENFPASIRMIVLRASVPASGSTRAPARMAVTWPSAEVAISSSPRQSGTAVLQANERIMKLLMAKLLGESGPRAAAYPLLWLMTMTCWIAVNRSPVPGGGRCFSRRPRPHPPKCSVNATQRPARNERAHGRDARRWLLREVCHLEARPRMPVCLLQTRCSNRRYRLQSPRRSRSWALTASYRSRTSRC